MREADGQHVLFSGCAVARSALPPFAPTGAPARNATIALARDLTIDLWEAPHMGCCGARSDLRVNDQRRRVAIAPLQDAWDDGADIVCLSPACRRVVECHLPVSSGQTRVLDLTGLLTRPSVLPRLANPRNPLTGLRVAVHSTCHSDHNVEACPPGQTDVEEAQSKSRLPGSLVRALRPGSRSPADKVARTHTEADSAYVAALATLVNIAGSTNLGDASRRGRCAWHPLLVGTINRFLGDKGSAPCLEVAARARADLIVTPCFLCFMGLNTFQRGLPSSDPAGDVPVLYLSQLSGLAGGIAPQRLDLGRTAVSARRVLQQFIA